MSSTVMPRTIKCLVCEYKQVDFTSYYVHKKTWDANHDIDKCLEIRRAKNAFDKMFAGTFDSLSNLSIIS